MALKDRIAERGIEMAATLGAPANPDFKDSTGWTCVLKDNEGGEFVTPFYMGRGHGLKPPTLEDVIESLCSDAAGVVNARDFDDFASEYGLDTDSRAAERTYRACVEQTDKLREFLGDAFDAFVFPTPDAPSIADGGAGGFLDPPGYPTHTKHIDTGDGGSMSIDSPDAPEEVKAEAARLIAEWHATRPAFDSDEVRAWVSNVLGYYRNCYRGGGDEPECWNVGNLRIWPDVDPVLNADVHAGVRLIRKFWPDFKPTAEDFAAAKWGQ